MNYENGNIKLKIQDKTKKQKNANWFQEIFTYFSNYIKGDCSLQCALICPYNNTLFILDLFSKLK